ncbi:hypothetical protein RB195_015218 [Necator americanus]|uniref:Snake toxin/toxin-like domain-containing protein n=1 Tax=Necator americanus TaxID=51031 RepID=A0ABR1E3J8_NECAM
MDSGQIPTKGFYTLSPVFELYGPLHGRGDCMRCFSPTWIRMPTPCRSFDVNCCEEKTGRVWINTTDNVFKLCLYSDNKC